VDIGGEHLRHFNIALPFKQKVPENLYKKRDWYHSPNSVN